MVELRLVPPLDQEPLVLAPAPQQFSAVWDPSPDQEHAFDYMFKWYEQNNRTELYTTVGGYAGTGKTALTGQFAKTLVTKNPRIDIAFATYTGKASTVLKASRERAGLFKLQAEMKEALDWYTGLVRQIFDEEVERLKAANLPIDAFALNLQAQQQAKAAFGGKPEVPSIYVGTIHRLLYKPKIQESTGRVVGWERQKEMPYDLIVIDEASMVPESVFRDLCSFRKPILAVGDHGQLPPVGEEAFLMKNPKVRLEKIHRQAEGNPILHLSMMIREGKPMREILDFANADPTGRLSWQMGQEGIYEALEFASPPGFIISYTNRLRCHVNKLMRQMLKKVGPPQPGEVLICVKNAYLGEGLLANGARVTVLDSKPDPANEANRLLLKLDIEGVGVVEIPVCTHQFGRAKTFAGFDEIPGEPWNWDDAGVLCDYGYALTCHKSQGSQAPNVAVLMERALKRLDDDEWTRWFYTSVTRASDKVMLVTDV